MEITIGTDLLGLSKEKIEEWVEATHAKIEAGGADALTYDEQVAYQAVTALRVDARMLPNMGKRIEKAIVGEKFVIK